jgi:hypothetical protein
MTVKVKGKAEAKEWEVMGKIGSADDPFLLAKKLSVKSVELNWEERGIIAGHPEVEIVLHALALEERLEILEKKHQDLIDNLRIFIGKEEDGTV